MKARRVKELAPGGRLGDQLERIVAVRLDELCAFMPAARDPEAVAALHDMRIAAKRLRYILEIGHGCFGPYARRSVTVVKDLQDLLGEVHDCDVQVPEVLEVLGAVVEADVAAGAAEHWSAYAGLTALVVELRARRNALFARFVKTWEDLERQGFRARLEFALGERPASTGTLDA